MARYSLAKKESIRGRKSAILMLTDERIRRSLFFINLEGVTVD